jgi:hypothetical protein
MCCFSSSFVEIVSVSGTLIFVCPLHGESQFTIYQTFVETKASAEPVEGLPLPAMVLPFPNGAAGLELVDLSQHDNFFSSLSQCFPYKQTISYTSSTSSSSSSSSGRLAVEEVGGYRCSVARNLQDLQRVDLEVFSLPDRYFFLHVTA